MATGGSAYIRLQKPDNEVSQSLQYWGNQIGDLGKEYRDRNEKERLRKIEETKKWEDKYGINYDDFNTKLTGFNNPDDVARGYALDTSEQYKTAYRNAEEARRKGDYNSAREFENEMLSLKNSFKTFNEANVKLGEIHDNYVKLAQAGKISGASKNWEQNAQAIANGNYKVINRKGVPILIGKREDGELFEIRYEDVIKGDYKPIETQDINGSIKSAVTQLGELKTKTVNGLYEIEENRWNDRVETGAKAYVESMLTNDMIGDVLYKTKGLTKEKDFTTEEKDFVRNHLYDLIKGSYKEVYNKTYNKEAVSMANNQARIKSAEKIADRNNTIRLKIAEMNANDNNKDRNLKYQMHTEELEQKLKLGASNSVTSSEPYVVDVGTYKGKDGKTRKYTNVYTNYTLSDKDGKPTPFYVTGGVGAKGVVEVQQAGNVEVNKSGNAMRVTFLDGSRKTYERNTPEYNSVMNQIAKANRGGDIKEISSSEGFTNSDKSDISRNIEFNNDDPLGLLEN